MWLRVLMLRATLDREIAAGASRSSADRALALRMRQLTARRTRRKVAHELRRIVRYADRHGSSPVISCVIVERAAVREGREAILGLAEHLESDAPVSAAGVVRARALLTGSVSPLHNPFSPQTVNESIFEVQDALGTHTTSEFGAPAEARPAPSGRRQWLDGRRARQAEGVHRDGAGRRQDLPDAAGGSGGSRQRARRGNRLFGAPRPR